jgi:lysophospholipase L1-like esterase
MIYNTILCIGDSLTYGARDEYNRGYPVELAKMLNDKDPNQFWIVINEGINGQRSGDILRRLPKALTYQEVQVILFNAGTNDCMDLLPTNLYQDNMYQIIKTCQVIQNPITSVYRYKRRIILSSLISLEGFGLLYYGKKGTEYLNEYNSILHGLSRYFDIPLVDLTSLAKYRVDACHLNNAGYKEMARLFMEAILKL